MNNRSRAMFVCLSTFTTLRNSDFGRFGHLARCWFRSAVMRYETILMMYLFECNVRIVRCYMLGASTVSKSTARGVLFRAWQQRRETTIDETYMLQTSLEKFNFQNCCIFRRSDEHEATFRKYFVLWANTAVTTRYVEVVIITIKIILLLNINIMSS